MTICKFVYNLNATHLLNDLHLWMFAHIYNEVDLFISLVILACLISVLKQSAYLLYLFNSNVRTLDPFKYFSSPKTFYCGVII